MKLDFDITTAEYTVIRDILGRLLPPEATVWVFGSRAKGTARFNSDLDLAIESEAAILQSQIYALKEAFNDAPLSFRVDVVDLAQVDAGFRKIIEQHRVSFPMAKSESMPRLRFPEFAGVWADARFDYWFKINAGGDVPEDGTSRKKTIEFPFPVFANSAQNRGLYGYARSYREDGDCVTVSGRGELGIPNARHEPFVPIVRLLVLRPRHPSDVDFFENAILRTRIFVESTGVPQLTGPQLSSYRIAAPTLPEQKKIAGFLGVVDAKIAALRAKVEGLETYKCGLMQALFSQTLRFTKPDGTAFPDWEEKKLGEVFDWIKTNSLSREFLNYENGAVQNIHYGDIHTKFKSNFAQDSEQVPFVTDGALAKNFSDEEYCQLGDVVIADASEDYVDIGKAIEIVQVRKRSLVAGLHTYIGRPKATLVALGFAGYLFRTPTMRKQIMRIAQGISVLGISKPNLSKLELLLPHPEEQQKIAETLSAMDAKIQAASAQVSHMETFKKGLLQQMFV